MHGYVWSFGREYNAADWGGGVCALVPMPIAIPISSFLQCMDFHFHFKKCGTIILSINIIQINQIQTVSDTFKKLKQTMFFSLKYSRL